MTMAMIMSIRLGSPVSLFLARAMAERMESKEKIRFIPTMRETVFATEAGLPSPVWA